MAGQRIALLLEIGFGTLQGSANSLERIEGYFGRCGFTTEVLRGSEVTRARIGEALASLRRRLRERDSFVLYFVGHGDRARGERVAAPPGQPPMDTDVLLLLTHDLFDPTGQAPPGIAGAEMLAWLSPIAEVTGDVTVILDCCRAATMTAGEATLDTAAQARIDATLARAAAGLRTKYGVKAARSIEPEIVRLVATTANEIAVERDLADGAGRIGLFTDALVRVLDAHQGEELSWAELLPEIADIVRTDCPTQRPGVEGPRHRVPFSRRERPPLDEHLCVATRGGWSLHAGILHGVEAGDRFMLGPVAARAVEVGLDQTRLQPEDDAELPRVLRARRVACVTRQVFAWPEGHALPDTLIAALRAAPELEIVVGANVGLARLEHDGDAVVLRDCAGAVVHAEPAIGSMHGAARLVAAARRLVRWERQRAALADLRDPLICAAFGRVGAEGELPRENVKLREGEALWIRAWGTGEHPEVFASLFHLHADRSLTHLTEALDHGISVPRSRSTSLADAVRLVWPAHVPRGVACDEALLVITSLRPRAFHRVATDPWEPEDVPAPWTPRGEPEQPGISTMIFPYQLLP